MISCPTCVDNLAEYYGKILIDGAIKKVSYFCCLNAYATKFKAAKKQLSAQRNELQKDIDDAEEKNETRVEDGVELWRDEADAIIEVDTETSQKCFSGLHPNCIGRYQCGEDLEEKTLQITNLLKRKSEFTRVARPPPKNPGIKYDAPQNFIDFKSRESKFKELVDALKRGNCYIIGLQGLGGMGKTTLAKQVGVHVAESEAFRQVIFTTVSDPPNINKIRRDIAEKLNFPLEGEEEQHSKALWSRIANSGGKVLIILDDIWEKLELRDIGIPHNHKNCCVLITTRHSKVCEAMECQPIISLNTLKDRDGLDILMKHVGKTSEVSTKQFMDQAQEIVKVCGGLPLAIVTIATMLKGFHLREWKNVLKPLLNSGPLHNGDYKDWIKVVHSSLKLSYDKLENKGKHLLLLCSLFPKDYEIPIEFLNKLGTGLSLFGEANNYSNLREKLVLAKIDLIKSFLLLETKETCVKMHDLVREVAISIEDKDVQVIMNSSSKLKSNLKFLSWSNNGFPNHCDGTKLEVLLLWIKGEVKVKDSYVIFEKMEKLRVLFLHHDKDVVHPTFSLQSFLSLKDIRTLILDGWRLRDISILKELKTLVTLEFESCLIMELPKEIVEIKSLRLLGIRRCRIERNNPFEVIGRCSQLEELYFVENDNVEDWKKSKSNGENINKVRQDISPPLLQMYSVACSGLRYFADDDNGLFFNTEHVENLMSKEMLKYLVERAEILELCKTREARWKSIVPGIISMKDGVMKDLIKLCLYNCTDIECLLDNSDSSGTVGVFSHLVELCLDNVDAQDLHLGHMPPSFLSELKIFRLLHCKKLCNRFFKGNLELPNLTVLQLYDCPMFTASIFRPSVARSLVQLQELCIKDCGQVKTLIENQSSREEGVDAEHQSSDGSLFPELKSLKIQGCGQLQLVLSVLSAGDLPFLQELSVSSCERLEYIFGEYRDDGQVLLKSMLPSLTTMELETVPSFINICKAFNKSVQRASHGCCCLPSHSSESMKRNETPHPADQRPLRQSWSLQNKRKMTPMEWPSLKHINLGGELVKRPFPRSMVCLHGRQPMLEIGDRESVRRPCPDLMVCLRGRQPNLETWTDPMKLLMVMQKLTRLGISHSEIKEIFNLEGIKRKVPVKFKLQVLEIEGLPNLRCIYKDPNNILNLYNLEDLAFSKCDQLRAIFSTSTMKSLPQLSRLAVTQCNGLVCIIEDDGGSHQLSLPKLQKISISHCRKLESFSSISTFSTLEELKSLEIEEAASLKEVFGQGDSQERGLEDVVPNLLHLKLKNLRKLERFCGGIDVQSAKKFVFKFEVVECGIWGKPIELKRNEEIEEPQSTDSNTGQAMPHVFYEGASGPVHSHLEEEAERKQQKETQGKMRALPKIEEEIEEVTGKTGEEVTFSETSAVEETMESHANGPTPALERKASQISPAESKMTSTSLQSNAAIPNERVQEGLASKDDAVATPLANTAPSDSVATLVTPPQTVIERIPEETVFMKQKGIPYSIDSQGWDSHSSQSTLSKEETKKTQANGPTPTLEKKASETSSAESKMKSTSLHSNEAISNGRVQRDLTSKDEMVATPIADNKPLMNSLGTMVTPQQAIPVKAPKENISHVIPSYHQGVAGPSSQILGIGEILEVIELKDGEPALLAKALELYPQLRLPREQRTRPIIAFSYRVLINILIMLSTKSPSTLTASEKLTLKANLDAATYFGFDRDWIESVRAKVFGIDMFDVLGTEEILVKKAELETYSATLEKVQNQRIEAMERVAVARKHLDLVQSELEAIDSQLFGRLEERKKLIINMMQFREIIKANYRPFGIY